MADAGLGFGGFARPLLGGVGAPGTIMGNQMLLGEAGREGFFSPFGSPRLRMLARRRALRLSDLQRRRAMGSSQLYGLDPMAQRAALSEADIGANAGLSEALNNADLAQSMGNQEFLRQLYGQTLGYNQQRQLAKEQQKAQNKSAFGSAFGQLGGAALGFFL